MVKRNVILLLTICFLVGVFSVATRSQTRRPGPARSGGSSEIRKRIEAKRQSLRSRGASGEAQRRIGKHAKAEEKDEFWVEEEALGLDEERWKAVREKLAKIKRLSWCVYIRVSLSSAKGDQTAPGQSRPGRTPGYKWGKLWANKPPDMRTDAEKVVDEIIVLVDSPRPDPEKLREKMEVLRRCRQERTAELSKAQQELRELLTVRQQAAMVLQGWLGARDGD